MLSSLTILYFKNAAPDVVKVLAGNKCECTVAQRSVDKERGEKVILFFKILLNHLITL